MAQEYVNRFGRKGGRGIRPWLIVPKIIAVGIYVGGLSAVLALWLGSGVMEMKLDDPRRQFTIEQTSRLLVFLVVPALLVALLLGVVLLCRHFRHFIRLRWLHVKLAMLLVFIPTAHLFCRARMTQLRMATDQPTSDRLATQLAWAFALTLVASIGVVILGRAKPFGTWHRDANSSDTLPGSEAESP